MDSKHKECPAAPTASRGIQVLCYPMTRNRFNNLHCNERYSSSLDIISETMFVEEAPQAAAVADKVAGSAAFARSKRHRELLHFLASQPVGAEIKETLIGHEFF